VDAEDQFSVAIGQVFDSFVTDTSEFSALRWFAERRGGQGGILGASVVNPTALLWKVLFCQRRYADHDPSLGQSQRLFEMRADFGVGSLKSRSLVRQGKITKLNLVKRQMYCRWCVF